MFIASVQSLPRPSPTSLWSFLFMLVFSIPFDPPLNPAPPKSRIIPFKPSRHEFKTTFLGNMRGPKSIRRTSPMKF